MHDLPTFFAALSRRVSRLACALLPCIAAACSPGSVMRGDLHFAGRLYWRRPD